MCKLTGLSGEISVGYITKEGTSASSELDGKNGAVNCRTNPGTACFVTAFAAARTYVFAVFYSVQHPCQGILPPPPRRCPVFGCQFVPSSPIYIRFISGFVTTYNPIFGSGTQSPRACKLRPRCIPVCIYACMHAYPASAAYMNYF